MPNSAPPFQPTTSVLNDKNEPVAWDLLEQSCREVGLPATAQKYGVKVKAIHARKTSHKWKGIKDARSFSKGKQGSSTEITTMTGDLSHAIDRHRATVFSKTSASIAKFRAKAPKNFRELGEADKIARRALGIDEDKPAQQSVLIQINEAIGDHEPAVPVEAHEVFPCTPEPVQLDDTDSLGQSDAGDQGSSAPPKASEGTAPPPRTVSSVTPPTESNAQPSAPTHGSLTLNAGDASRRRFVIP